jgi:hypothetical protein
MRVRQALLLQRLLNQNTSIWQNQAKEETPVGN